MIKKASFFAIIFILFTSAVFAVDLSATYSGFMLTRGDSKPHATSGFGSTGKVFLSENKERVEPSDAKNSFVTIYRFDKEVRLQLSNEQSNKYYYEEPFEVTTTYLNGEYTIKDRSVFGTKVGREKINGILCDKYKKDSTFTWISVADSIKLKTLTYIKKDDPYVGKMAYLGFELKDIKYGPQDPSLFEVPEGYRRSYKKTPIEKANAEKNKQNNKQKDNSSGAQNVIQDQAKNKATDAVKGMFGF
jgi:hypothetical protein